jgi:hypothetical protein
MASAPGRHRTARASWLGNLVGITDPDKPFYSLRHSRITDLRVARTTSGEIAVKPDIERYLTAHGKEDEHGGMANSGQGFEGGNRVGAQSAR